MPRYTDDSREKVRDAVDFAELVGAKTELKRAGARRLQGLCPFHEERTPSFGIDPVEKLYHCFGCGRGGDVFAFAMETEGLDFAGALEALADRYGVELEREAEDPRDAARRVRRERLLALLERTAAYYVRVLWESAEAAAAREYLASRGLTEGPLREFRVGFSPSRWDRVLVASRRAGYTEEELLAAGLASRPRGGRRVYDRFPGRVMVPPCGQRGRALARGPRDLRPLPRADHVPAVRRARPRARLRRAGAARGSAPQVPQHLRRRALPQGPARVRRRPRSGRRRPRRPRRARRGLHRR